MPDSRSLRRTLIRGHPQVVPTKVGNHLKDWVPVFTGNPGFLPSCLPQAGRWQINVKRLNAKFFDFSTRFELRILTFDISNG